MAITISNVYVKTFESNLRFLAQQSKSRLRQFVTERSATSSKNSFPRLGAQSFAAKAGTGRIATPANDSVWSNRVAIPATYHGGDSVEPEDIEQMLVEPRSSVAEALARAARRQIDDLIITGATSDTQKDEAGNNNAFPAGQKLGSAVTAFDFSLVTQVTEKFLLNDIDPEDEKVFVVSPNCVKKMMAISQYGSRDYTNAQALDAGGVVDRWMGYTWVVSTRLAVPGANQRLLLAFTKRALGLLVVKDIWSRVAEDPSISFAFRVYAALTMGVARVEDEQIAQITVLES